VAEFIACTIKQLPKELHLHAAHTAIRINPVNRPASVATPEHIALLTSKYWGAGGVKLTVSFMDNPASDLRARILQHMNAWASRNTVNVSFTETAAGGQVRIARANDGYWSYLGTDILQIPMNQQTMNLQGFTMSTPESEFHRVVRHETGHTLGFPHEHMRKEIVERIDPQKAYAYFWQMDGWDQQTVDQQELTPLDDATIQGTPADVNSIMCYQLPASITKDGQPIPGGIDIDDSDYGYAAKIYPSGITPPPPPTHPSPLQCKQNTSLARFAIDLQKSANTHFGEGGFTDFINQFCSTVLGGK
jgi:hypothetical protein